VGHKILRKVPLEKQPKKKYKLKISMILYIIVKYFALEVKYFTINSNFCSRIKTKVPFRAPHTLSRPPPNLLTYINPMTILGSALYRSTTRVLLMVLYINKTRVVTSSGDYDFISPTTPPPPPPHQKKKKQKLNKFV